MQPESITVSQHTPPIDSSQSNPNTTQHGNVLDDGAVSGPLPHGETGDSAVVASSPPLNRPPLSDDGSAPPSPARRVIEHEIACSPQRRDPGFRVVKSLSHSDVPLESLPNGMSCLNATHPRVPLTYPLPRSRGTHSYLVASASPYSFCHDPGLSSISRLGHHATCLASCLFAFLSRPPSHRVRSMCYLRRDGAGFG